MPDDRSTPIQLLDATSKIVAALEPLTAGARARVILACALQLQPCPVDDDTLQALLQAAKQP